MFKKIHTKTEVKPWFDRRIEYGKQQNEIIISYNLVLFGCIPIPLQRHFYTDYYMVTSDEIQDCVNKTLK